MLIFRDVEGQLCFSLNLTAVKDLPKPDQGSSNGSFTNPNISFDMTPVHHRTHPCLGLQY